MFGAARQCEEFINENHRRKHVVRFCSRYSGFDLQLRQRRSPPGEGAVQRLPARAALHAWPRPEMARQASALVKVRFLKPYRRPGGTSYHQSVILRRNNLMRLPEFTRSTTLPRTRLHGHMCCGFGRNRRLSVIVANLSYFYFSLTSPPRWSAWRGRQAGHSGPAGTRRWKKEKSGCMKWTLWRAAKTR